MWIHRLQIENFKSIHGEPFVLNFEKGVNFFVGDNNVGKTTVFQAIEALISGFPKDPPVQPTGHTMLDTSVEMTLVGVNEATLEKLALGKLTSYVEKLSEDHRQLKLRRSTERKSIEQKGKTVELDEKKLLVYNPETKQFENPAGIDKTLRTLLRVFPIWADMDPDEVGDFSTTKTMGKLIAQVLDSIDETDEWQELTKLHAEIFGDESSAIGARKKELEDEILDALDYGFDTISGVEIIFNTLDSKAYLKAGEVHINDGTSGTVASKGNGLQRTVAIALLRILANREAADGSLSTVLIDEPETWLHPRAQISLSKGLNSIGSTNGQVFVSTHSPYIFRHFDPSNDGLYIMLNDNGQRSIRKLTDLGLTIPGRPSLAEISFKAFGDATPEYHSELFGTAHEKAVSLNKCGDKIGNFDQFLKSEYPDIELRKRLRTSGGNSTREVEESLPVCLRNLIHHPEVTENEPWDHDDLRKSIELLEEILEDWN